MDKEAVLAPVVRVRDKDEDRSVYPRGDHPSNPTTPTSWVGGWNRVAGSYSCFRHPINLGSLAVLAREGSKGQLLVKYLPNASNLPQKRILL